MPSYEPLSLVYAIDEDLAIREPGDFPLLCPQGQRVASGSDGALSAGQWTLTAPSIASWPAMGATPGQVVQLEMPKATISGATQYLPKEILVVDEVTGPTLTLRRVGMASGLGMPPGPAAGVTAAARYAIVTLAPQVEDVSYELNRRFGVRPDVPGRTPEDFFDAREVNQACVLTVLRRQYEAMARQAGDGKGDDLWAKARAIKGELDEVLGRLVVHWQSVTGWGVTPIEPTTTRLGTRITR